MPISLSSASACSTVSYCAILIHRNYLSRKQEQTFLLSGRLPRFLLLSQNNNKTMTFFLGKTLAFLLGESSIIFYFLYSNSIFYKGVALEILWDGMEIILSIYGPYEDITLVGEALKWILLIWKETSILPAPLQVMTGKDQNKLVLSWANLKSSWK